jgi:hypothetical protein
MEIVTTCIGCWQPSAAFFVNSVVALTVLGFAVWRSAWGLTSRKTTTAKRQMLIATRIAAEITNVS